MARYKDRRYTRLGSIYHNMKTRCNNPNYDKYMYYGGRGISVCDEWSNSYNAFESWALANGYTDTLTLDRIDPNGNYCPENCRWISRKDQANNRTSNHCLTHNGRTMTIQQWAEETGIPRGCIDQRIAAGWDVNRTLTEPVWETHRDCYITFNGETKRLYEWANQLGIKYKVLHNRINLHHWPIEKALTTPVPKRC